MHTIISSSGTAVIDVTAEEIEEFVQSINAPLHTLCSMVRKPIFAMRTDDRDCIHISVCMRTGSKMARRLLKEEFNDRIKVEVVQGARKKARDSSAEVASEVHYWLEITTPQNRRYYLSFTDVQFAGGFKGSYYQKKRHVYENGMIDNDVLITNPYYVEWCLNNRLSFVNFRDITDESDYRQLMSELGIKELTPADIAELRIKDERIDEVDRLFREAVAKPDLRSKRLANSMCRP